MQLKWFEYKNDWAVANHEKVLSVVMMPALFSLSECGSRDEGEYERGLHLGFTKGNENSYAYVYIDVDGGCEYTMQTDKEVQTYPSSGRLRIFFFKAVSQSHSIPTI